MKKSWEHRQHSLLKFIKKLKREENISARWFIACVVIALVAGMGQILVSKVNISPRRLDGGVFWADDGLHYLNASQVEQRIVEINMPAESAIAAKVSAVTPTCDSIESGFCQQSAGVYVTKALKIPAVAYQPGTPDTKKVIGYCTLCNDGTFSPSCAVGRGACSWHGGVQSYDVAEYVTVPGTAAVQAQPAVYTYAPETYKDSTIYQAPPSPTIGAIVNYKTRRLSSDSN